MKISNKLNAFVAVTLSCSMLLSGTVMAGESAVNTAAQGMDLALAEGGVLSGAVVTAEGQPIAGVPVRVYFDRQAIAQTVTDESGRYAITGLRGGVHQVAVAQQVSVVRLWNAKTAPQNARHGLVTLADETIVRGNYDPYCETCPPATSGFGLIDIVTLATVGTSTAALIVALDNNDKLDDLAAAAPPAPASP